MITEYHNKYISEMSSNDIISISTNLLFLPDMSVQDILRYTVRIGEDSAQLEGAIAMLVSIQKAVTSRKLVAQLDSYEGDITQLSNIIRHVSGFTEVISLDLHAIGV